MLTEVAKNFYSSEKIIWFSLFGLGYKRWKKNYIIKNNKYKIKIKEYKLYIDKYFGIPKEGNFRNTLFCPRKM